MSGPGRNLERKARLTDPAVARRLAAVLGEPAGVLLQTDTYFRVSDGRLKLRESVPGGAELIAYRRPDAAGPRGSDFVRVPVPDPDALLAALTLVPGVRVVVRKRREVWLRGNVRFHIDAVEGLGDYLEYEVGVGDSETAALAQAAELDRRFGLTDATCFAGSYADLLEQQN